MITMCNYIFIYYNIYDILVFDDPYDTQQLTGETWGTGVAPAQHPSQVADAKTS